MQRDEEIQLLAEQQKREDNSWQTPEKGVISYNRPFESGEEDTVEGFVRWFNRESRKRAVKLGQAAPEPTEAQKELMALALIREKHGFKAAQEAAYDGNGR